MAGELGQAAKPAALSWRCSGLQVPPRECGLAIDLKRRGGKKRQLLHSGFTADAERTDLPAGSSAINWMSYSGVGYGFGIRLAVLEKAHGAEPRWMCGPGWGELMCSFQERQKVGWRSLPWEQITLEG